MYLECKRCETDNIELTSPYDRYPFYCNKCNRYLKFEEVVEYKTLATHYHKSNYVNLIVIKSK